MDRLPSKMLKFKYPSLAFVVSSFRVADENVLFETDLSCPRPFFRIFSLLLKGFLFVVTASGVLPCGGPKTLPLTSSIVQFIFYF